MRKELRLLGCWGYNLCGDEGLVREILREPPFPLDLLITHRVPLRKAAEMVKQMVEGSLFYCKVTIDMEGAPE
jgi:threonine dehydrogenase-like Zn-dependent dehydrogenase